LIYLFPEAETYLNSYSYSYQSQDAMLKALLGENEINGRLPVTIPDSDLEYGSGIVLEKSLNTTISYSIINNYLTNSIDEKINLSLSQNLFPGAVVLAAKDGKIFYNRAFGKSGVEGNSHTIEKDEIFNAGKLSNLFTTASALKLADAGLIQVDDELFIFFDGFFNPDKRKIKIKDLITHSSGLGTNIPGIKTYWDKDDLITNILNQELSYLPGSGTQYTIQNTILLREIIEMKSGEKLSTFFEHKFQKPLEIFNSGFSDLRKDYISIHYGSPPPDMVTVKTQEDFIDEIYNADTGHTSGFSGFYSNASELAVFSQMLLQNGYYGGTQIMNASKVDNWFNGFRETEKMNTGSKEIEMIDPRGCSININKDNNSFIIILTNAGIRNPSNKSFVDFSEKLIQFFNEEISRGIL
jgi:CubicO group peptidase (beta-lactamase class C family)